MNSINNLTQLKFFNERGVELYAQKEYVIQWKLLPCSQVKKFFQEDYTGYFIANILFEDNQPVIDPTTISAEFINNPGIYKDDNFYEILTGYPANTIENYIKETFFNADNEVEITIDVQGTVYKRIFNVNFIFNQNNFTISPESGLVSNGDNATDGNGVSSSTTMKDDHFELIYIDFLGLQNIPDTTIPFIYRILAGIDGIAALFPFIHYQITLTQDTVSTDFVAANTILVLQENGNTYQSPYLDKDVEHSVLLFQCANDSELKLFEATDNYEITYKNEHSFDLSDGNSSTIEPLVFYIGFTAEEEGCYQNYLGMYIRTKHSSANTFFLGALVVKTEVIGEDERYRTLLNNFGIPDPVKYSNIFAEADFEEDYKDYKLINDKSKQLFLSYDKIFPYVGTYKALFNAIKYLGYTDIIFKEWYRIKDSNDQERDVAIQTMDDDGNYIKNTLAHYGVSVEDFDRYNKLNKITMVYHINRIADEAEDLQTIYLMEKDPNGKGFYNKGNITYKNSVNTFNTHRVIRNGQLIESTYFDTYDIPTTRPIFTYCTDMVIAKLDAVRAWLEKYIIGVNSYIQEITGEGVYLTRFKSHAYVTEHAIADFQKQAYFTPVIEKHSEIKDSSAIVYCTLAEYNSITFDDYDYVVFDDFLKYQAMIYNQNLMDFDVSICPISNSIEAPLLGDEIIYNLISTPDSMSFAEYEVNNAGQFITNNAQLYVYDGEIDLLEYNKNTATFNSNYNITIEIEIGNIRKCFGNWRSNIIWAIREVIDQNTGNTYYEIDNVSEHTTAAHAFRDSQYIVMTKEYGLNVNNITLKYTNLTKWNVPMFVIKGFVFNNISNDFTEEEKQLYTIDYENEYILEIIKGRIIFNGYTIYDYDYTQTDYRATLLFSNANETGEQIVKAKCEYETVRMPVVHVDMSNFTIQLDNAIKDEHVIVTDSAKLGDYLLKSLNILQSTNDDNVLQDLNNHYKRNVQIQNELNTFLQKRRTLLTKKKIYEAFLKVYDQNYTFNKSVPVKVNHFGEYKLQVKVFDKYNNIFTNISNKPYAVTPGHIAYDTYMNQEYSDNNSSFYRFNKNGEYIIEPNVLLSMYADTEPMGPRVYRIYNIEHDKDNNVILYDNISYAIDTPKNNDYFIASNLSEIATEIIADDRENGTTTFGMLDENPNKMDVYRISSKVNIILFDKLTQTDINVYGPLTILDSYHQDTATDKNYANDSYITVDQYITLNVSQRNNIINGRYIFYVYNITKYIIDPLYVSIDYDNEQTYIEFPHYPYKLFNADDVIKITYTKRPKASNLTTAQNNMIGEIWNEVAYRIVETDYKDNVSYIKLNGFIDLLLLEQCIAYISYPYSQATHYSVKVVGDADEYTVNVGFKGYTQQKARFKYNHKQLFLNDYLDNTFSGYVYDFEMQDFINRWYNPVTFFKDADLYKFEDFPVTVPEGRHLLLVPQETTLISNISRYDWKWTIQTIDETDNIDGYIHNNKDYILFKSGNKAVSVIADMLGANNVELVCTDIYGNRITNNGSSNIYVKEKEE